jgi:murein L,D-transpeptidase YcbB/YkuD
LFENRSITPFENQFDPLPRSKQPETRLELPEIVPVYITYLTAQPGAKGGVAFRPDVYGRDGLGSPGLTAGDFAR